MPVPAKPCVGAFSDATIQILIKNTGRAQWASHTCELCGQQVSARIALGKWSPETHWPSVHYTPRTRKAAAKPAAAAQVRAETWPDGAPI